MNRKKILKIVVAASAIAGGVSLSSNTVHATPDNNTNNRTNDLTKSSTTLNNATKGKVVDVSTNLRVRADAGTNHEIIGYLYNGQEIEVNAEKGSWYRISFNGREGYVSKEYIVLNQSAGSNVNSTGKKGQVINVERTSSLNIRQSATTGSAVLGTLQNDDTFEIISNSNGWYNIKTQNIVGFVKSDYVKEIGSSNETTPVATTVQTKTATQGKVINIETNLRIRTSPSTSASALGYLLNGQEVSITGEEGNWYAISYNNKNGYASKDYIQKESASATTTNANTQVNISAEPQQTAISGKGAVTNISSRLNIRESASTSSAVLGALGNGESFDILGKSGNWYNIKVGAIKGYVSGDYVKQVSGASNNNSNSNSASTEVLQNQKGQVINITSNLRIRSTASTGSTVLGYLLNGQIVDTIGKSGQWVKINYNGKAGYVSNEFIKFVDGNTSNSETSNSSATFSSVFSAMKSQLGSPYVWGGAGENLTTTLLNQLKRNFPEQAAGGFYNRAASYVNQGYRAFDCSGLLQWGFKQAGISIGRTTWDQIGNGTEVSISSLKPGDLLFYSSLQHVGMYIGNGQWIESPNSSSNVRISDVPWSRIGRARRILG